MADPVLEGPDWVWVDETALCWRLPSQIEHCRWPGCADPPVADLERLRYTRRWGTVKTWYAYCARHMYGRRIRDGRVERAVHPNSPLARQAREENTP